MTPELWTAIVDAVVSIAVIAVGIWIAPEYRDFALAIVAALQGVAAALITNFVAERKIAALRADIHELRSRIR